MRLLRRLLLAVVVLTTIGAAILWWRAGVLHAEQVRPGVWALSGIGGNVGVLVTDAGTVVVDSMTFVRQGRRIEERIGALTDQPIAALINTHYHLDHTHGNPAFPTGTRVVSTKRTLEHLQELDASYWAEPPARDLMPHETFTKDWTLEVGGQTVRAIYPGRGHTDGDLVVLFEEARVLHAGDLVWNGFWPKVDPEAGGTLFAWPATLDVILQLDFDIVIPSHGPVATRVEVEEFQTFLVSLWRQTFRSVASGVSRTETIGAVDLEEFGMRRLWYAPQLSRSLLIGNAYDEARTRQAALKRFGEQSRATP